MSLPPVYALYCEELPERKAALEAHLAERGLPGVTYFRAVHGATWGLETALEYEPGHRLPPGHVALNLSSWFMWAEAERHAPAKPAAGWGADPGPLDPVIFFEDDVELPVDFRERVDALFDDLERDFPEWDLVFLGLAEQEPGVWHKVTERIGTGDSRLCRLHCPFGTHALMVRRRAIPVLLRHMRKAERNLDQQLWKEVLEPGRLRWCAVLPTIVKQRTYDYAGTRRPEWAASTLRPEELQALKDSRQKATTDSQGKPPAAVYAATLALIDPFPCIYRSEPLEDHGRVVARQHPGAPSPFARLGGVRRTVPLNECARLNRSCHSRRDSVVFDAQNEPAVACETCALRLEMAPGATAAVRDRLPTPDGHFNPSIAIWNQRLILATRDSWGHSKVALWDMTNETPWWDGKWSVTPVASLASGHPLAPRLEDPRLFTAPHRETREPRLHASFSLPDGYPPKIVRVGYSCFSKDLRSIEYTEVMDSPNGNAYEKNWTHGTNPADGSWYWVYAMKPDHVVLGEHQTFRTPNPFRWTGGVMRGGATPILVKNENTGPKGEMYAFFHGCLKRTQGSVYSLGVYTYNPEPPFEIRRQAPVPLVWPDLPAADETVVKRYVVFPGGVVPHAGHYHVAVGVDDTYCRIVRLPFDAVEAALALTEVGSRPGVSVRDTAIATGVKR